MLDAVQKFLDSTGFLSFTWQQGVMIIIACILLYLAIVSSLLLSQFESKIIASHVFPDFILNLDFNLYCLAIITTIFALIMYIKTLNKQGLIKIPDEKNNTKI